MALAKKRSKKRAVAGRGKRVAEWFALPSIQSESPLPLPAKLPDGPPRRLTQEEALEMLWSAKNAFILNDEGGAVVDANGKMVPNPNCCNVFVYATLIDEVEFHLWNGTHPPEKNTKIYKRPAGTRVLVTMVSRFGDVGIRDYMLDPPSNGYASRVMPERLTDWGTHPKEK